MSFKTRCVQIANRRLKGLGALVASATLLLGSLVGAPESRAQGPSEAETIKFIVQLTAEASTYHGGPPKHHNSQVTIQIEGQTIRSNHVRTWYNRGLGGYISRNQTHLSDLAEVRLVEDAIIFECRDGKKCIEERREDTNRRVTSTNKTSSFSVPFRQDVQDEQKRIVKALLHLAKLRGLQLVDGTVNKDLFK